MVHQPKSEAPFKPSPRLPRRLLAGLIAAVIFIAAGLGAQAALSAFDLHYLDHIAPTGDDEAVKGLLLTRQAIRDTDRLVLMGSSELTFQDQFHAARVFSGKPTGFSVYVVGSGYRQSIHNFMALSALGKDVENKRLVLFISPTWFTKTIGEKAYRKNFSTLQAYEFVYSSPLSPELKQRGAQRLLELGGPAIEDPLLRSSLEALAKGRPVSYWAEWPLGRLALQHARGQDAWDVARLIYRRKLTRAKPSVPAGPIDWQQLMGRAAREANVRTSGNPFGMDNDYYKKFIEPKLAELKDSTPSESWMDSTEWDDLQLTLDALKELHARPLFVSLPLLGSYADFKGHAVADRQAYYQRVKAEIEGAGFPVVDLSGYEYEQYFHTDPWHQGWKGSVTISEKLDQFYHGQLPGLNE